jgi:hypothetical protein
MSIRNRRRLIGIRNNFSEMRGQIILLSTISFLFIILTLARLGSLSVSADMLKGCILSLTNAFLGYVFIERAFRLNNTMFLVLSFAGMALRFFLMIASIALFLIVIKVNAVAFVGAFLSVYVIGLAMEVIRINNKLDQLRVQKIRVR